jgi:hypothetical protein
MWITFIWLRTCTSVGSCEHGNENLVSIKVNEFPDSLEVVSFPDGLFSMLLTENYNS